MELKLIQRISILAILSLAACTVFEDPSETANQRFVQSMEWNNTHPSKEISVTSDDYFILAMGDSHVGTTTNLDELFNIGKSGQATAVIMAGDLTSGKSKDYDTFQKHLPSADSLPTFLVAGNHDLWSDGWKEFLNRFGSSTYQFTVKTPVATDLFICLETGGGTLGDKQLSWLIDILKTTRSNYRHCVVITHNNIIRSRHTESTNPPIEETEVLLELFNEFRVDMSITAHDHQRDIVSLGNTTYIIVDALEDGLSNAGYFKLQFENGGLKYEFENF
jgi:3',5'-cyclic AMP phosphodiesterase CpdA